MKEGQIEIVGLLMIVILIVVAGGIYLTMSVTDDVETEAGPTTKRIQDTFTTVLTDTSACTAVPKQPTLADLAAASLNNVNLNECGGPAGDVFVDAVNNTVLPNTLDFVLGEEHYEFLIQTQGSNANYTFRGCPPPQPGDRRTAETQQVYTSHGEITVRMTICRD